MCEATHVITSLGWIRTWDLARVHRRCQCSRLYRILCSFSILLLVVHPARTSINRSLSHLSLFVARKILFYSFALSIMLVYSCFSFFSSVECCLSHLLVFPTSNTIIFIRSVNFLFRIIFLV